MSVKLEWIEGAPPRRNRGGNREIDLAVAELRKRPGQWARVVAEASSSGASTPWKKRGCEAYVYRRDDKAGKPRFDVYARWPEQQVRTASQREAAEAYARQHGHTPKPAPAAPKPLPAGSELTPEGVKQQLARRLGHRP